MALNKKALAKDLKKWIEVYSNAYCDKAADLLTKYARAAILDFYNSYTPLYYHRYDNLLNKGYKRYKHNNAKYVYGGVYIGYKYMQDYGHKGKITGIEHLKLVTNMTLFHGYHGTIIKDTYPDPYTPGHHFSFPPYASLQMVLSDRKFHDDLDQHATYVAKKVKYEVLNKII